MTLVRIIKDWDWPDIMRQTPQHKGIWNNIQFTTEAVEECDYVVVLNRVPCDTAVRCSPNHIWAIIQEPPTREYTAWLSRGFGNFYKVYTQEAHLKGKKYVHSHGALPWSINSDYDHLKAEQMPEKPNLLSCVSGDEYDTEGKRRRVDFIRCVKRYIDFDLWGRGFTPIADKQEGVSPYRYSLAIENYSGPFYWTEKITDCFLCWTMPLYYGCTNIDKYFPKGSYVWIDINSKDAVKKIKDTINSDLWHKNIDAIASARERVLERYQLFPFVSNLIHDFEKSGSMKDIYQPPRKIHLKENPYPQRPKSVRHKLHDFKIRILSALLGKVNASHDE